METCTMELTEFSWSQKILYVLISSLFSRHLLQNWPHSRFGKHSGQDLGPLPQKENPGHSTWFGAGFILLDSFLNKL